MKISAFAWPCIALTALFVACVTDSRPQKGCMTGMSIAAYALSAIPDDFTLTSPCVVKVYDVSIDDETPHVKAAAKVYRVDLKNHEDELTRSCYVYCNSNQRPFSSSWKRFPAETKNSDNAKNGRRSAMSVSTALALFAVHYPEENLWSARLTFSADGEEYDVFIEDESHLRTYLFSFLNGRCISDISH